MYIYIYFCVPITVEIYWIKSCCPNFCIPSGLAMNLVELWAAAKHCRGGQRHLQWSSNTASSPSCLSRQAGRGMSLHETKTDQHLCMLQVPRACLRWCFPFFWLQGSEMRSCNIGILKLVLRLHSSCTLAHQFHQCFIACSKPWNSSRWSFQTCAVASPIPSNNQSPELLLHAACQLTWWSWWPQSIRHGPCHCRSEKLKRYISPSAVIAKTSSPLIAPKLHSTDLCEKSGTTTCIDVMLWWPHSALYLQGWDNAFLLKKQKWNLHLGYSTIFHNFNLWILAQATLKNKTIRKMSNN